MDPNEALLRQAHSSLCIRWGTTAPYAIGRVSAEKVGYAQIPSVVVSVTCRDADVSALVPIVRQRVFAELVERGWTDDVIAFSPSVQRGRRRKFRDENESSETCGRDKFGNEHRFRFDIADRAFAAATFQGFGSFARLPERGV
jgi:hypothetical protein